jgi:hypothetical protein
MPIPVDQTAVERQLAEALETNFLRHRQAQAEFRRLAAWMSSGPPGDDGDLLTMRMRMAGESEKAALAAYKTALRQFTEFVIHGKIPEELPQADRLPSPQTCRPR